VKFVAIPAATENLGVVIEIIIAIWQDLAFGTADYIESSWIFRAAMIAYLGGWWATYCELGGNINNVPLCIDPMIAAQSLKFMHLAGWSRRSEKVTYESGV